jgi:peptide/nickel transport system permease protein
MERHLTKVQQLLRIVRRLLRNPLAVVAMLVLGLLLIVVVFPQWFAQYDPYEIVPGQRLLPPSRSHLFGTDEIGRDVLSRVIYGARTSVVTAVTVVLFACTVGTIVGALAGYGGPILDAIIMRIVDITLAFPALVLAMAIVAAIGRGLLKAMIAMVLIWWAQYARLVRGQVLQIREREFVQAAQAIGAPNSRILIRHILPNCLSPILVKATLDVAVAILFTSFLSFLGLGVQPPEAEWGVDVSAGRAYLIDAWWYPTFPGLAIFVTVMALNLFGDAIRDVLDVRLQSSS